MPNYPNRSKQQQAKHTPDAIASFKEAKTGTIVFVSSDGTVLGRASLAECYMAYRCHAELLAALKDLELFMSQCGYFNSPDGRKLALQTRAAIAKAEGR